MSRFVVGSDRGGGGATDRWWSSDTVAVVTGGNKGIGFEIVRRLAVEGLTVILTARDERRGLEATHDLHAQGCENVAFRVLDISSEESVEDFAEWLADTYGGLDILVNNAAVFYTDHSYQNAVQTVRTNYQGTMDVIEKLLPLFRPSRAGARIITISSWAGRLLVRPPSSPSHSFLHSFSYFLSLTKSLQYSPGIF